MTTEDSQNYLDFNEDINENILVKTKSCKIIHNL